MFSSLFSKDSEIDYNQLTVNRLTNTSVIGSPLNKILEKIVGVDKVKFVFNRKLTNDGKQAVSCLKSDLVRGYIMSGKEGVEKLLFPFLNVTFTSKEVSDGEKRMICKQLRADLEYCEKIIKNEFQEDYLRLGMEGIDYFKKHINLVVEPYKVL